MISGFVTGTKCGSASPERATSLPVERGPFNAVA